MLQLNGPESSQGRPDIRIQMHAFSVVNDLLLIEMRRIASKIQILIQIH
jgi:hypothetical protein